MWTDAFAQASGAAPAAPGAPALNPTVAFLIQYGPILLIFAVMYLLLIRPQQAQQNRVQQMLKAVKKGDKVVTSGGIIGTVVGVDDSKVVLRIAEEVKVEFLKSAIIQVQAETGS